MAGTMNVPGFGATKKTTVYVAGGIGAVIIGVVWYRSRNSSSTDSGATTDATSIDPATGYAYGSPDDAAALAANAGYQTPGGYGGGFSDLAPSPQQPQGFTSNQAWKQAADDYLINTVNLDALQVSDALGRYLVGDTATPAQRGIIQQAIASEGYPPVPGPNGYPPAIRDVPTSPTPVSKTPLATPRLSIGAHRAGLAAIIWTAIPHATEYHVYRNGKTIGGYKTHSTNVRMDGAYTVVAFDGTGKYAPSAASNPVAVNV
jgi:hypothetical protein